MGFGQTVPNIPESVSSILLEAEVFAANFQSCSDAYANLEQPEVIVEELQLCLTDDAPGEGGSATCQGDSGGPVLLTETGVQVGIVSFGLSCGSTGFPSVNTRVSGYEEWIRQSICAYSDFPPDYCADVPAPEVNLPCSICGDGMEVTNPLGAVVSALNEKTFWCPYLEVLGESTLISHDVCSALQSADAVQEVCACATIESQPTCSICGKGSVVTNPLGLIPVNFTQGNLTTQTNYLCGNIESEGLADSLSPVACSFFEGVRNLPDNPCGCEEIEPVVPDLPPVPEPKPVTEPPVEPEPAPKEHTTYPPRGKGKGKGKSNKSKKVKRKGKSTKGKKKGSPKEGKGKGSRRLPA
jgi:hypothetical protein